jgi:hypothetical protein
MIFCPYLVASTDAQIMRAEVEHCEARFRHALTAEMSETFPSWGSMHASVKLEGIDGRAPQERVEHVA